MTIQSAKFEAIRDQYKEALFWIEKIGIRIENNRVYSYLTFLNALIHHFENQNFETLDKLFPDSVYTFYEVNALIKIHNSLSILSEKELSKIKDKLSKAVCGPESVTDETNKNNHARNYLFELLFSSRMHDPNKNVTVNFSSKTDSEFSFLQKTYLVECKRIQSEEQIGKNVRRALKQLNASLKTIFGSNHRGIIALDVSKIINPGFDLFVKKDDRRLQADFNSLVDSFIQSHSHKWQNIIKEKSKKIVGVILRISLMGVSKERNILVTLDQWAVNPRITNNYFETEYLKQLANTIDFQQKLAFT